MWCGVVWCGVVGGDVTIKTKSKKPDDADSSMMYQSISSVVSPAGDIVVSLVFNNNLTLSLGTFQYLLPNMRGGGTHTQHTTQAAGKLYMRMLERCSDIYICIIFNVGWLLSPSLLGREVGTQCWTSGIINISVL